MDSLHPSLNDIAVQCEQAQAQSEQRRARARLIRRIKTAGVCVTIFGGGIMGTSALASGQAAAGPRRIHATVKVHKIAPVRKPALRRADAIAGKPYGSQILRVARQYQIPGLLLFSVVEQESAFDPNCVSEAGAQGLMQLMPSTARQLGVINPLDPGESLDGGARFLKQQYARFGDWKLALAAYNAGPGAVIEYGGVPPFAETREYVAKITAAWHQRRR